MNILIYDMGSYMYDDVLSCLRGMGHNVRTVYYSFENRYKDEYFDTCFRQKINEGSYDLIFSINFFPLVALSARDMGIPYVSWSYDSPLAEELTEYFELETNYIFLFDRIETQMYKERGFSRVFHMPLAVNVDRIKKLAISKQDRERFSCDISFVGQLYEQQILSGLMLVMDEYTKGFVSAMLDVQLNVYGEDLLSKMVTPALLKKIDESYRKSGACVRLTKTGLVNAIQRQITFAERVTLLETFGEFFDTKYYNTDSYDFGSGVKFMGPVKYMTEMPKAFMLSKLNLCATLRGILSGIPLRSLDILAAGGALFSNYQIELAEHFQDGIDVIMYSSIEEAFDKVQYYLQNDEARIQIAQNGQKAVQEQFSYEKRMKMILDLVEI